MLTSKSHSVQTFTNDQDDTFDTLWRSITILSNPNRKLSAVEKLKWVELMKELQRFQMEHRFLEWYQEFCQNDLEEEIWVHFGVEKRMRDLPLVEEDHIRLNPGLYCQTAKQFMHPFATKLQSKLESYLTRASVLLDSHLHTEFSTLTVNIISQYTTQVKLNLLPCLGDILKTFYLFHFHLFHQIQLKELGLGFPVHPILGEEEENDESGCTLHDLKEMWFNSECSPICTSLREAGIHLFSQETLANILRNEVVRILESAVSKNFTTEFLPICSYWVKSTLIPWVEMHSSTQGIFPSPFLENLKEELESSICELLYKIRLFNGNYSVKDLFDIIVDYPDSEPAIVDIKGCMRIMNDKQLLIDTLKYSINTRLLHPGANTSDILTQYVATIKCLRLLDSSGVLLDIITEPIKKYLRRRHDTVRCVILGLISEDESDIFEGLDVHEVEDNDIPECQDYLRGDWEPDPIDSIDNSERSKAKDIITTLLNMFENRDIFTTEFQSILAENLLHVTDYNTDKEIRQLELMRLRFEENSLQNCEVMMKDIADSKRIDAHIHSATSQNIPIHSLILSRLFWPDFQTEELKFPAVMENILSTYSQGFGELKAARKLQWIQPLGKVTLDVELGGDSVEYKVSPPLAAIIIKFSEQSVWDVADLSIELGMEPSILKKRISFWVQQNIIENLGNDKFQAVEKHGSHPRYQGDTDCMEESMPAPSPSIKRSPGMKPPHSTRNMRVFWTFIMGILTNLGALPLERIQSMLTNVMRNRNSEYSCNTGELQSFLEYMMMEDKLECIEGLYRLKRK